MYVNKFPWSGYYVSGAITNKDILLFLVSETFTDFDNSTNTLNSMKVMILSVDMLSVSIRAPSILASQELCPTITRRELQVA